MMVLKAVLFAAAMFVAAAFMGNNLRKEDESPFIAIVYGFMLQWAAAFLAAVPLIVKERTLSELTRILIPVYILLVITGLIKGIKSLGAKREFKPFTKLDRSEIIYLSLFLGIVLFQLYKTVFYAYADGDDAFYVASARIAEASGKMYRLDAYVGITTPVPYRYALAPFPMWVAMLARVSTIDSAALSHSVLAPMLIAVTYFLYNEISKLLFGSENREKRYMFLTLVAVFEMFSNVSTSTSGKFLLTRARQGKEALACIVLPLLFYCFLRIVKSESEIKMRDYVTLFVIAVASSLTSLLANVLVPLAFFGAGIWMLVKRKKFVNILLLGACLCVNLATVILYIKIR